MNDNLAMLSQEIDDIIINSYRTALDNLEKKAKEGNCSICRKKYDNGKGWTSTGPLIGSGTNYRLELYIYIACPECSKNGQFIVALFRDGGTRVSWRNTNNAAIIILTKLNQFLHIPMTPKYKMDCLNYVVDILTMIPIE